MKDTESTVKIEGPTTGQARRILESLRDNKVSAENLQMYIEAGIVDAFFRMIAQEDARVNRSELPNWLQTFGLDPEEIFDGKDIEQAIAALA